MTKAIAMFLLIFTLTSCRVGCVIEETMTGVVASGISSGLQCKNYPAVQASVKSAVEKLNMCPESKEKKLILGPICALLATYLVNGLANATIPTEWECDSSAAQATLTSVVIAACNSIPL